MDPEARAPGWIVTCLKCGFSEPWGRYGIRRSGVGKFYTFGWCPRCQRVRCHVVRRRKRRTRADKG